MHKKFFEGMIVNNFELLEDHKGSHFKARCINCGHTYQDINIQSILRMDGTCHHIVRKTMKERQSGESFANSHVGTQVGNFKITSIKTTDNKLTVYNAVCEECGYECSGSITAIRKRRDIDDCSLHQARPKKNKPWYSHKLAMAYHNMILRCYKRQGKKEQAYTEKGIKVCSEWLNDANIFEEWALTNGYEDGLSIDRIDSEKDYSPNNCRWIPLSENEKWTSRSHRIEVDGITDTAHGWSLRLGHGSSWANHYISKGRLEELKERIHKELISKSEVYTMSNMLKWAEDELKRYNFDFYGDNMNKAVLEVLKTLVDQGHTNMSASVVIRLVDRLWSWKPLTPLTGEDDEWTDEADPNGSTWQNKRYPAVFKNKETGECYDIDGIVFEEPYENFYTSFTCNKSKVLVTFPYMPPDKYPRYRLKYNTDEKSVEDQLRDNEYEIV